MSTLHFCYFLPSPCQVWHPLLLHVNANTTQFLKPCCCCCITSVVSNFVRPHRQQPTRLPSPWDSPGKNTGVGCNFLLQCMKVKSESEVAQSCLTLRDPMDCSLPGSFVHGIFQARVLEWGAIAQDLCLKKVYLIICMALSLFTNYTRHYNLCISLSP